MCIGVCMTWCNCAKNNISLCSLYALLLPALRLIKSRTPTEFWSCKLLSLSHYVNSKGVKSQSTASKKLTTPPAKCNEEVKQKPSRIRSTSERETTKPINAKIATSKEQNRKNWWQPVLCDSDLKPFFGYYFKGFYKQQSSFSYMFLI